MRKRRVRVLLRREEPDHDAAERAARAVDGEGVERVVDEEPHDELRRAVVHEPAEDAGEEREAARDRRAAGGDRDEAGEDVGRELGRRAVERLRLLEERRRARVLASPTRLPFSPLSTREILLSPLDLMDLQLTYHQLQQHYHAVSLMPLVDNCMLHDH